jgi:tRNA(Ile)-lysidine synthase
VTGDPIDVAEGTNALNAEEFAALVELCPSVSRSRQIAVGVSGGADSMALTLLLDAWARRRGVALTALTVDHGLRDDSATEANVVGMWLRKRGISHETLKPCRERPASGIQSAARRWRLDAFDAWCRDHEAGSVLLAHTAEDQAETLWLRILADSGPDGLAAMQREIRVAGLTIARPLLSVPKERLVATCRAHGQEWIEDPSNQNPQFTRVRLRRLAPELDKLGLGSREALRIAQGMSAARLAMDRYCATFLAEHGGVLAIGAAWFDGAAYSKLPTEFGDLLLSRMTQAVGGAKLPPRRARVAKLAELLRSTTPPVTRTLSGCLVSRHRDNRVWVFREVAACEPPISLREGRKTRWDNRFELYWQGTGAIVLGALEEDGWRWIKRNRPEISAERGLDVLPHAARLSIPAIRELDGSVSVPHFVGVDSVRCATFDHSLAIGFSPDARWIGPLIAAGNKV